MTNALKTLLVTIIIFIMERNSGVIVTRLIKLELRLRSDVTVPVFGVERESNKPTSKEERMF